eukprot:SAG31_NODE_4674_length_3042_cov_1.371390_1_plen_79_part_00
MQVGRLVDEISAASRAAGVAGRGSVAASATTCDQALADADRTWLLTALSSDSDDRCICRAQSVRCPGLKFGTPTPYDL